MSSNAIDKWLDDLEFENYRLSFTPTRLHAQILESRIRLIESLPVTEQVDHDLVRIVKNLETLKRDLASVQELIGLTLQLRDLRDQMLQKGFLQFAPEDGVETFDGFHTWYERKKLEQRRRQRLNFAFLRHFYPMADKARKRRMVDLFATYSRRRFMWGTWNLRFGTPARIGRWASRMCTRMK